jgi:hypothetical protein
MAEAVSRRPRTAEALAQSQDSRIKVYGGQSGSWTDCLSSSLGLPLSTSPQFLHIIRTGRRSREVLNKPLFFSDVGDQRIEGALTIIFPLRMVKLRWISVSPS